MEYNLGTFCLLWQTQTFIHKSRAFIVRPIDGALLMFDQGCKVFPVKENGKTPALVGWQDWAETADRKKVENYGTANPLSNWGVYCGASGLVVIDVDNKDGKDGSKALAELQLKNKAFPITFTVRTTTGGLHLYFTGEMPNSVGKIAEGVDVRGIGGFVVAPYSRIDEKEYEVSNKVEEIPPIPDWFKKIAPEKEKVIVGEEEMVEDGSRNATLTALAGVIRSRGAEYDAIFAFLLSFNETQVDRPLDASEVRLIARSVAKYPIEEAEIAVDFIKETNHVAIRGDSFTETDIPKRDWVMEGRYIGGFISLIIAPGGVGKSSLSMLDAVSVATGNLLSGAKIIKKGPVWIYNTEDPMDELKRKIIAIAKHHNLLSKDLHDIHITSGRDNPLILAKEGKLGVIVNDKAIDSAMKYIRDNKIILLIADPFIRTHSIQENNNVHVDKVAWCFQQIAEKTGCAVGIVHHTSKGGSKLEIGDMNAARGAGALVNASRIAHILTPMSEDEADRFNIKDNRRSWYVRLDNAKANLQPPASETNWFEKISVELANGDRVGTIEKAELIDVREEKRVEALDADCKDLGDCLAELITIDEAVPISYIVKQLNKPRYNHLHTFDLSEKRASEKIIAILQHEVYSEGTLFKYEYRDKGHTKHFVKRDDSILNDFL